MAVKAGGGGDEVLAEINITPFTDVLLVLLIIFMLAACAVIQHGFNINLPKATTTARVNDSNIIVSINHSGGLMVGDRPVAESDLVAFLKRDRAAKNDTDKVIIMAAGDVPYYKVISAMDEAKQAGLNQIALATSHEAATK